MLFRSGTLHVVDKSAQLPTTGIHGLTLTGSDRAFTLDGRAASASSTAGPRRILIINGKKIIK